MKFSFCIIISIIKIFKIYKYIFLYYIIYMRHIFVLFYNMFDKYFHNFSFLIKIFYLIKIGNIKKTLIKNKFIIYGIKTFYTLT